MAAPTAATFLPIKLRDRSAVTVPRQFNAPGLVRDASPMSGMLDRRIRRLEAAGRFSSAPSRSDFRLAVERVRRARQAGQPDPADAVAIAAAYEHSVRHDPERVWFFAALAKCRAALAAQPSLNGTETGPVSKF